MARIEYRFITRRDTETAQLSIPAPIIDSSTSSIPRAGVQASDSARAAIRCSQDILPDEVCGIVAFDDAKAVARIGLFYTQILIDGRLQKCAVGSGFFVDQNYRDRAIGLAILLKALTLGVPYIEASVSGQMFNILRKLQKFKRVDRNRVFQVPVDCAGILQMARWDLYSQNNQAASYIVDKLRKARIIGSLWRQRQRIARATSTVVQVMEADQALEYCLDHFHKACFRVQLPWTVVGLRRALSGDDPNHAAWLLKVGDGGPWLVSLYRRARVLGYDDTGQPRMLLEAHLNEIYPPPNSVSSVLPLLSFALKHAMNMTTQVMHIHAMTPAIFEACKQSGLHSRTEKSIFIAPVGVDDATRTVLSDAGNWWCRAISEDQFEESFSADASPDIASCVPAAGCWMTAL